MLDADLDLLVQVSGYTKNQGMFSDVIPFTDLKPLLPEGFSPSNHPISDPDSIGLKYRHQNSSFPVLQGGCLASLFAFWAYCKSAFERLKYMKTPSSTGGWSTDWHSCMVHRPCFWAMTRIVCRLQTFACRRLWNYSTIAACKEGRLSWKDVIRSLI